MLSSETKIRTINYYYNFECETKENYYAKHVENNNDGPFGHGR